MQLFKFLSLAFVLPLALASPATDILEDREMSASILERQTAASLTDFLSELTDSLGAIKTLLSASSLNNIEAVVTDLSTLFADPPRTKRKL
jgi:hypothetical protein